MKSSILIRLISEETREWRFSSDNSLLRFGSSGVEVSDERLGSAKAQITFYEGYWWIQSAPNTELKVSDSGRASALKVVEGSSLLKEDSPNIISLNRVVIRIEFIAELSPAQSKVSPSIQISEQASSIETSSDTLGSQVTPLKVNVKKAGAIESDSYEITSLKVMIGRDPQADIKLDGRLVSRQHAQLQWTGEFYSLDDLGSTLGVQLNGAPLQRSLLINQEYSVNIGPYNITLTPMFKQEEASTLQSLAVSSVVDKETGSHKSTKASGIHADNLPTVSNSYSSSKADFPQTNDVQEKQNLVPSPSTSKPISRNLDQQKTRVKYRQTASSRRNVDLKWREPLDVFRWSNLSLGVFVGILLASSWVVYWFAAGETLKVGSLSSAHSSSAYQELNNKMSHLRSSECNACHTYEIPQVNQEACLSCHEDLESKSLFHIQHKVNGQKGEKFQDCAQCHVEHKSDMVSLVDEAKCLQCHPNSLASNSIPKNPLTEVRHDLLTQDISLPKLLTKQAVPQSVGIGVSANSEFIHAIHGKIDGQCVGCHASVNRSSPVDPKQQCGRCHSNQVHTGLTVNMQFSPFEGSCLSCHTISEKLDELMSISLKKNSLDALKEVLNHRPKFKDKVLKEKSQEIDIRSSQSQNRGLITGLSAGASILFLLIGVASRNRLHSRREDGLNDSNIHEVFTGANERSKKLINIFDDACVGCGECVTACPYDVLALLKNKDKKTVAKVVNFDSCNECNDCVVVCKPQALTRRNEGEPLPMIEAAILDAQYMTNIHGLYLIGEASGTSLVRNANNLGSKVAQHIAHRGESGNQGGGVVDVVIIGAGPAGVSAAITAKQKGLSYVLFEQGEERLNILATQYPKGKQIQNQPSHVTNIGPLPMDGWDVLTKEEFLKRSEVVMNRERLEVRLNHKVTGLERVNEIADGQQIGQARFVVHTLQGSVNARNTILAVGARGAPRQLGCPGEDHPMIQYHLTDPELLAGQQVIVVGGGNSALEAAIAIGEANAAKGFTAPLLTLVYRGEVFKKASDRNQRLLKEAESKGVIKLELSMNPAEVGDGYMHLKPSKGSDKTELRIQTNVILCMIGSLPPSAWMKKIGVEYTERPQGWSPSASDDLTFLDL